ncbi:MAG: CO dehydrogenase/acetyl-CoA synthase subunit delta [Desulfurococcaceae archaeon]|nr:CO dehydrogenase/acetyl-CoA synthase subunit delta [Desulfurococcaceae archaeon]
MSEKTSKRDKDEIKAKQEATIYGLLAKIIEALEKGVVELYNVEVNAEELEIRLTPQQIPIPVVITPPQAVAEAKPEVKAAYEVAKAVEVVAKKVVELAKIAFEEPRPQFSGRVLEVKLGASRGEGGSRDSVIVVGGHTMPAYYYLSGYKPPHPPAFGGDVFDMKIGLPRAVKLAFGDALDNPAEWARIWVEKYGAEAIDIHLVSTDPTIKDASPEEAVKTVDTILQVVKVPIVVGGSGNPEKDIVVFRRIVEAFPSEGLVINSLNLDMKLEDVCPHIAKTNAIVIDFSPMDLDKAEQINRKVYEWIPRNRIMLDLNIGGIGYGTEYGFTTMERARLSALIGNELLQHPFNVGAANAWGAREAWITMDPYWGPKEIRGPLWETLTSLICLLTGADYYMLVHPLTVKTMKAVREYLFSEPKPKDPEKALDWLSRSLPVF